MPFVLTKESQGWWFVREIVDGFGGRPEAEQVTECQLRNDRRLESKRTSSSMAQVEYRRAKDSYPRDPIVKRRGARDSTR